MERRIIVIAGPTASGKTLLGIKIAKRLESEIISADSRQFYKGMDIGTAKPTKEELSAIKHHFIDNLEIDENYNVGRYEEEALKVIENLHSKNIVPVVIGGSGLYIKAIVDGILQNVATDENYRKELLKLRNDKGNEYIYEILKKKDPVSAANMLPQNWKRVIRALEVLKISGKPIWQLHSEYKRKDNFIVYQFALLWEREKLYRRIEERVEMMIEKGLVKEVRGILDNGYSKKLNALNTVGYKEIIDYSEGKISLERAVELIKRNSRRYAKRQLTWFRRDKRIEWLNLNENTDFEKLAEKIIREVTEIK